MVPRNLRQEAISLAYVRAVAAQAGVICSQPQPDFGVDLCLRRVMPVGDRRRDAGAQIDLQVKSTTRAAVAGAEIVYDLEAGAYNDLRDDPGPCPRVLVVLLMPAEEGLWLAQTDEALTLRHCAYWRSLRGAPARAAVRSVRVTIPLDNVFSPEAVSGMLQRVAERREL